MIFATPRLIARRFEPRDLAAFVAMRNHPEVARYQTWDGFSPEDGQRFLDEMAEQALGEPGWFQFALEDRLTGCFVGDCGLNILTADNRLGEVGYSICPQFWNRGYATEAITALIHHAFTSYGLHRISAATDPRNTSSRRVLEKAGFHQEAHFRQSLWFKGGWADDVVYAVLRSDVMTSPR